MLHDAEEIIAKQADELYQDGVILIQLFKDLNVLQLTFKVQPDPAQFRHAYQLAIGTAIGKGVKGWLTDARQITRMLPENQVWLKQQMAPLLQAGLQKFAILMTPECFVMTNPDKVYNKPTSGPENPTADKIKVHFDREEAFKWLVQ
ncbi:hypothetical protein [Adhaeribacter soli]|uniref:STAS/SEC14 domain-containing protein n=1 Tax=Adhaeribacter soli TaxID=2607655 RepID=A0A5N1J8V0_9BACT|nr:hypothetical protein [Adhaeribacter soli]KAA9345725.1 hypothetical protein F0P94_01170 [Adhaeribacter soli]